MWKMRARDQAGYSSLHKWAAKYFEPIPCEHCGGEEGRMEWATKHDRKMSRDRSAWLRLCFGCHRKYDGSPWSARTHCKHGHLFDEENTRIRPDGGRVCRECVRSRSRRYKAKMRRQRNAGSVGGDRCQAQKTHCPQGHPYDNENTYLWRGKRKCRTGNRERVP